MKSWNISLIVFGVLWLSLFMLGVAAPSRPNILWILAEDMSPDLGLYGVPEVHTPHLDGLARRGMHFTRVFTTSPVCSPSRSAFMTGMYQTTIGAHNHRSHRPGDPSPSPFPLPQGVRVLTDWLRDAGYFTANIRHLPEGVDFQGTGKTDWNFSYEGEPYDSDRWADLKNHQPFFAQMQFPETHRGEAWDSAHLRIDRPADPSKVQIPPYYPDHPVVRQDWAQYLNAVMALDRKVGVVLDLLQADGLAEHTVVIFFSDHGRAMMRAKQWPYDSGLRIPLILYWPPGFPPPAGYQAGTESEELLSALDVTATTLALAGVPKPEKMQGRIFLGKDREPPRRYVFGGRDRGDETVDRIRTVRSARYRYLRNFFPGRPFLQTNRYKLANYETIWVMKKLAVEGKLTPVQQQLLAPTRPIEELYDLQADPHETQNLAASPAHRQILHELRRVLDRWLLESDDQGRFPEDPEVVEYYEERARKNYDERIQNLQKKWGVP